jgi:hypothetical protein
MHAQSPVRFSHISAFPGSYPEKPRYENCKYKMALKFRGWLAPQI